MLKHLNMKESKAAAELLISNIYGQIYEDRVCVNCNGKEICIPVQEMRRMKVISKKQPLVNNLMFILSGIFIVAPFAFYEENLFVMGVCVVLFTICLSLAFFLNIQKYGIQITMADSRKIFIGLINENSREAREFCWVYNVKVKTKQAA